MSLHGLNNIFESEAVPHALPLNQNSPQKVNFGLYTEQISGTSFTRPRANNRSVWVYRALPSSERNYVPFRPLQIPCSSDAQTLQIDPNPGRWGPIPEPQGNQDFIEGLRLFGQAGDPELCEGLSIYLYATNKSMEKRSLSFNDGEVLLVPQVGTLEIRTELGVLIVGPEEICVVPRGIKFMVSLRKSENQGNHAHTGYMVEVFNEGGFRLPELGVIGANGLANPLHFEHPKASFETTTYDDWENVVRVGGKWFHQAPLAHSPFDVVAWRGNLVPYKYDLRKFVVINTVSIDHPDPSIFTVLTVPTHTPGVAACDFVIFPPRWMVAQHTFRPPYFHRNTMTEFMGLIRGAYDGKKVGFIPGGVSLHSRFTPHGPDKATFDGASEALLEPIYYSSGMAFMFETAYNLKTTDFARNGPHREVNYADCWKNFKRASL